MLIARSIRGFFGARTVAPTLVPPFAMPMESRNPKKIVSIQVCRGLAAVVVVLAHLHDVEGKYCKTNLMGLFQFGVLGVDLFFVISGIVMASITKGKFGDPTYAGTFIYHRVARIFPVFWIYTTIVLSAYLYNPNLINAGSGHQANILASYFLIPTHRAMLVMQGWTLSYELYFYLVVFTLILVATRRSLPWMLGVWALLIGGCAPFARDTNVPVLQLVFNPLALEFIAGFVLYYFYHEARHARAVGVVLLSLAAIWLASIIIWTADGSGWDGAIIEQSLWGRPACFGLFAVLFIFGMIELERSELIRYSRFLESIGDWSYSIYLSHIIVIEAVARILRRLAMGGTPSILEIDLISIPAVLLVGYCSYTLIERPLIALMYKARDMTLKTNRVSFGG